ncbi:hypothetical protein AALP_AA2G056400 [Arabis alpina]|uniref:Uncharacterized protein n=1 Tax=Arabis alpina TaxID=50452 RepID=A0A087HFJ0_ARAAL|nr:hypothetical protein AALP_AA2G056400 [Arabis alpina]
MLMKTKKLQRAPVLPAMRPPKMDPCPTPLKSLMIPPAPITTSTLTLTWVFMK